jgi:dCMP deaminase
MIECPVCNGVAGVEVAPNDWFDCDFCNAIGKVPAGHVAYILRSDLQKWDLRFIEMAEHIAQWSKGPRTRVGAVVVRPDKSIASLGYNGPPRGFDDEAFLAMERSEQHKIVIHAEDNAVNQACFAENFAGYTIYVTHMPCKECAAKIIQAGIRRVVAYCGQLSADWRASAEEAQRMFIDANVSCLFATSE